MNLDGHVIRQIEPELGQNLARLADGAGAIGALLVPVRRQAQQIARIAGAERADDDIVNVLRVDDLLMGSGSMNNPRFSLLK